MRLCEMDKKNGNAKKKTTATITTTSSITHSPTTMRPVHNGLFTRYAPRLRFGHHRLFSTYIQECGSFFLCVFLPFSALCFWFVMFGSANMHVNKLSYRIATKKKDRDREREREERKENALLPRIRATLPISHRKSTSIFPYTHTHIN